jgi:hypothetical protein
MPENAKCPKRIDPKVLEVLIHQAGLTNKLFIEKLAHYLAEQKEQSNIRPLRQQVRGWLEGIHEPKGDSRTLLASFFSQQWPEDRQPFESKWLTMTLEELMALDKTYMQAIDERRRFTGIFRKYQEYVDKTPDSLRNLCKNHEHDYFLYRYHSSGELVRDVLRVTGHGQGHLLVTLYQHTQHDQYPQGIKTYEGMGFFYRLDLLYLFFTADTEEDGPEPAFLIFRVDNSNTYVLGTVAGISDQHAPLCNVVLRRRLKERLPQPQNAVALFKNLHLPDEEKNRVLDKLKDHKPLIV